jgi:hypothetical protein
MQKREINDNENTISLTKTITKTKIKSKTKLTLCRPCLVTDFRLANFATRSSSVDRFNEIDIREDDYFRKHGPGLPSLLNCADIIAIFDSTLSLNF